MSLNTNKIHNNGSATHDIYTKLFSCKKNRLLFLLYCFALCTQVVVLLVEVKYVRDCGCGIYTRHSSTLCSQQNDEENTTFP